MTTSDPIDGPTLSNAVSAIQAGELVVYPTETVYGLGADATDQAAIERVFDAKGRPTDKPISMAVPDIAAADPYISLTEGERAFIEAFLPGPVTVIVERTGEVPDVLTAGRDRVGLRIPDHDGALQLLQEVAPLTATSANKSGQAAVRRPADLHPDITDRAAVVIDGGETPGGGSTVVDVDSGTIYRRGNRTAAVERWLDDHALE